MCHTCENLEVELEALSEGRVEQDLGLEVVRVSLLVSLERVSELEL